MINAAKIVLHEGISPLSRVFKSVFPNATYHSGNAKRRLLQMPLVAMCIQNELFLIEKIEGLKYPLLVSFLQGKLSRSQVQQGITKDELKQLLTLAKSDRERECIQYAVFRASGISQTKARQQFGMENMYERSAHVEACISEAKEIKSAISELAILQDLAILDCYCGGTSPGPLPCLSESDTESDTAEEENLSSCESDCDSSGSVKQLPDEQTLLHLLCECEYNWFQFIEQVEISFDFNFSTDHLENFFCNLPNLDLSPSSMELVVQSHRAFNASIVDLQEQDRSMNGEIVSDSDCELTPEIEESTSVKDMVRKKRVAIQRCAKRLEAKLIAEKRFLQRKRGKRTSKIIQTCTDIGDVIEEFVKDHSVGADAWR